MEMVEQEDYSSLSLLERAVHKLWKVRLEAYEEMSKLFSISTSEQDPIFRSFLLDIGLWKKISTDSNVFAQEAGIKALKDFLEFCGKEACIRTRSTVIPCIVEKCLTSTRVGTRKISIEIVLLYVELDSPDPVLDDLLPGLNAKFPKLVAATTNAIKEIYRLFGVKTVDPRPVLKILPKLFAHSDNNVRKEATELAVVLYSWLGDALKSSLFSELKHVQIKELESSFEGVKVGKVTQERYLRSQQVLSENSSQAPLQDNESENIDFFDSLEPINILSKIPKDFNDQLVSVKWKDRKDALDSLYSACKVPRIMDDDYNDIIRLLARSIKDVNISVVIVASNCVEAFARGLRKGFIKYKSIVLGPIMEKLKERKATVIDALTNAMDAIFDATSLSDVLDDILEFSKHKNPQIRSEILFFLVRCLESICIYPKASEIKLIAESSKLLLNDTFEPVRNSSAKIIGILMKIVGERQMGFILDGVDDLRKAKIREYFESTEIKIKFESHKQSVLFDDCKSNKLNSLENSNSKMASSNEVKKTLLKPSSSKLKDSQSLKGSSLGSRLPSTVDHIGIKSGLKLSSRRPVSLQNIKSDDVNNSFKAVKNVGSVLQTSSKSIEQAIELSNLSISDKRELDELRKENSKLDERLQKEVLEKKNLLNEINSLQLKNAQLINDHTRDILKIKAGETQLSRARNEIEMMKSQLLSLRKELDQSRLNVSNRSTNFQNPVSSDDKIGNSSLNINESDNNSSKQNQRINISAVDSSFDIEKENSHSNFSIFGKYCNGFSSSSSLEYFNASFNKSDNISGWDSAADLTARLKERIEQMKRADMRQH
ncbi:hypothetical protein T552_03427 [Pneumocystis carinii B80]|uniref:TOG domain-containing protein n=2 Tax=Pneumocystis carinii TaxID=4754 RepID=A0A0W4ZAU0_PNEC8|nr:hypothetical protein T552_03427 [Pneumocystis carinii B80]KTW25567.1 hypothetical protein T552_03427 [Pneumocystis carinii B80]CAC43454.1 probable microtubule associated protein [Pneumocystis carinii]